MSDPIPALIELKIGTGVNSYDSVAVADQASEAGEAQALLLLSRVLYRAANAIPGAWPHFRAACHDAAHDLGAVAGRLIAKQDDDE